MMRNFIVFLILLLCANVQNYSQSFCQNAKTISAAGKLEKYVYKNYLSEKGKQKQLHIGLARPVDNSPNKKRPLIIGVHSGGFVDFCPFEPCYVKYSENVLAPNFGSQDFVTASIQYRLTSPLDFNLPKIDDEKLRETQYEATQSIREGIKYIFENAEKFGVDTENVFLVGTSAGAIIVLHAAFLDNEEVPKDLLKKYGELEKKEKIKGVISLSGAIYDLTYLKGEKVPLMIVHGSEDLIVPFEKGFYLGLKHLTPVFGGKAIFDEAVNQNIPAKGYFYDFGHAYPSRFQKEIFKNASDFIRLNLNCSEDKTLSGAAK